MTEETAYYYEDYYGDTNPQEIAMAIVPKFSALLSLMGSTCIICEVWNDHKQINKGSGRAVSRILMSMSISDLFFSLGWFLTTWPIPVGSPFVWGAVGNQATCSFQGFIIQIGWMATPLFNISLALFYLLMIRYTWSDKRLRHLEPWVHGIIWFLAWGTAIMALPLKLYNSMIYICWIDSIPYGCVDDECERGIHAREFAFTFQVFPVMVSIVCSFLFMGLIVFTVYQNERRSQRHEFHGVTHTDNLILRTKDESADGGSSVAAGKRSSSQNDDQRRRSSSINSSHEDHHSLNSHTSSRRRAGLHQQHHSYKKSRIVAQQAMWYVGAFLLTFIPDMISGCIYFFSDGNLWFFWLDVFSYLLLPAQGFFNFCVFVRRRQDMKTSYGKFLRHILCDCFCCVRLCRRKGHFRKSRSGWMLGNSTNSGTSKRKSCSHSGRPCHNDSSNVLPNAEKIIINPDDNHSTLSSFRVHHLDLHEEFPIEEVAAADDEEKEYHRYEL